MKRHRTASALMASSSQLRQPQPCLQCAYRLSRASRRPFSASTAARATMGQEQAQRGVMSQMSRTHALRSQKSQLKNIKSSQIPTDFGLVPANAKVFPSYRSVSPLITSEPMKFVKLIWTRVKTSVMGFTSVFYVLRDNRRRDRLTGKMEKMQKMFLKQRIHIAADLHKRLNTAIPKGHPVLEEIACQGLLQKVKLRAQYRKQARLPEETWSLVKYNGIMPPSWMPWLLTKLIPFKAVNVMRDFAANLPIGKNSYVRQVIVRIRSKQAYDKGDGRRTQQKDLTEYLVIQQMVIEGQVKEWMVWGTVEPATIKGVDEIIAKADEEQQDLSFVERMKQSVGPLLGSGPKL